MAAAVDIRWWHWRVMAMAVVVEELFQLVLDVAAVEGGLWLLVGAVEGGLWCSLVLVGTVVFHPIYTFSDLLHKTKMLSQLEQASLLVAFQSDHEFQQLVSPID